MTSPISEWTTHYPEFSHQDYSFRVPTFCDHFRVKVMIWLYLRMIEYPEDERFQKNFEMYEACLQMFLDEHIGKQDAPCFPKMGFHQDPHDQKMKLWYGNRVL